MALIQKSPAFNASLMDAHSSGALLTSVSAPGLRHAPLNTSSEPPPPPHASASADTAQRACTAISSLPPGYRDLFFRKQPSPYSHEVYRQAALVLAALLEPGAARRGRTSGADIDLLLNRTRSTVGETRPTECASAPTRAPPTTDTSDTRKPVQSQSEHAGLPTRTSTFTESAVAMAETNTAVSMIRGTDSAALPPAGGSAVTSRQDDAVELEVERKRSVELKDEKRLVFSLVFSTLKYRSFLEDMLRECSFFSRYPQYEDCRPVVLVILCDLKTRKFQLRPVSDSADTAQLDADMSQIEAALYACRTKLAAALARSRIRARVLTVDHLLPASVRANDAIASNMSVHCWVNQLKTTVPNVIDAFRFEGFRVTERADKSLSGRSLYLDHHCGDLLEFPGELRRYLDGHQLVLDGHLVIQDKSSCVGPHSVRALINEGDDVMHVNCGSGITTAHIASLARDSETTVYGFTGGTGAGGAADSLRAVNRTLDSLGARSRVKIVAGNVLDIDPNAEQYKHIKVALLTADCSRSGVANPVNFIVCEGEDIEILSNLASGTRDEEQIGGLASKHAALLKQVLSFPRMQGVVYTTRSLLTAENENVVMRAVEFANRVRQQRKTPFRLAPPVLPLGEADIDMSSPVESSAAANRRPVLQGKFLKFEPSHVMSGCFVATVTREADDPKEAAKDILARAAAKGIITGMPGQAANDREKPAKSKTSKKSNKAGAKTKKKTTKVAKPARVRDEDETDAPATRKHPDSSAVLPPPQVQHQPRTAYSNHEPAPVSVHVYPEATHYFSSSTTTSVCMPRTPPPERAQHAPGSGGSPYRSPQLVRLHGSGSPPVARSQRRSGSERSPLASPAKPTFTTIASSPKLINRSQNNNDTEKCKECLEGTDCVTVMNKVVSSSDRKSIVKHARPFR